MTHQQYYRFYPFPSYLVLCKGKFVYVCAESQVEAEMKLQTALNSAIIKYRYVYLEDENVPFIEILKTTYGLNLFELKLEYFSFFNSIDYNWVTSLQSQSVKII